MFKSLYFPLICLKWINISCIKYFSLVFQYFFSFPISFFRFSAYPFRTCKRTQWVFHSSSSTSREQSSARKWRLHWSQTLKIQCSRIYFVKVILLFIWALSHMFLFLCIFSKSFNSISSDLNRKSILVLTAAQGFQNIHF